MLIGAFGSAGDSLVRACANMNISPRKNLSPFFPGGERFCQGMESGWSTRSIARSTNISGTRYYLNQPSKNGSSTSTMGASTSLQHRFATTLLQRYNLPFSPITVPLEPLLAREEEHAQPEVQSQSSRLTTTIIDSLLAALAAAVFSTRALSRRPMRSF